MNLGSLIPGGSVAGMIAPSLLSFAGDIYSAQQYAKGQESANAASLSSAREQMAFQERMSGSAHQREVEDLRKAGLNPALSANAGASTPVGSSVEMSNAAADYRGLAPKLADSAFRYRQMNQDIKSGTVGIALTQAQKKCC